MERFDVLVLITDAASVATQCRLFVSSVASALYAHELCLGVQRNYADDAEVLMRTTFLTATTIVSKLNAV